MLMRVGERTGEPRRSIGWIGGLYLEFSKFL